MPVALVVGDDRHAADVDDLPARLHPDAAHVLGRQRARRQNEPARRDGRVAVPADDRDSVLVVAVALEAVGVLATERKVLVGGGEVPDAVGGRALGLVGGDGEPVPVAVEHARREAVEPGRRDHAGRAVRAWLVGSHDLLPSRSGSMRELTDVELLEELEPTVAERLDLHLRAAQDWLPHEYVPWGRGRDFTGEGGEPWTAGQSALAPAVQAAFELNLLTEDNLPSYHREIAARFGRDGAWGTWVHRWTAEEARHAKAIRDYLTRVPRGRSGRARARPHGQRAGGLRGRRQGHAALSRVREPPGARDPARPPQHRAGGRRSGRGPPSRPDREGREPPHGLLP